MEKIKDFDSSQEEQIIAEKNPSKVKEFLFNKGFAGFNNFFWIFLLSVSVYGGNRIYNEYIDEEKLIEYLDAKHNKNVEVYNQYYSTKKLIEASRNKINSLGLEQELEVRTLDSLKASLENIKDRALEEIEFSENYQTEEKSGIKNKNLPRNSGNCAGC